MFVVDSASTASLMPRYKAAVVNKNSDRVFGQESDRVLRDTNEHDIQNHSTLVCYTGSIGSVVRDNFWTVVDYNRKLIMIRVFFQGLGLK